MSNQRPKYDFWKNLAKERCLREPFDAAGEGEGATKIVFSKNTPGIDWFGRRSPAMQNIVQRCEGLFSVHRSSQECFAGFIIIIKDIVWIVRENALTYELFAHNKETVFIFLRYFLRKSFDRWWWGRLSKGANSERRPEWREKRKTPFPEMDLLEQEENHWKSGNLGQN